jgi:chromosome segregation ATPase
MRVADEAGDGIIQEGKNLERLYGLVANLQRNVQELGQKGESNSVLILELQQQRGGLQRQLIYAQDQHEADESRIEAVHRELDATRFERDTTLQKLSVSEQKRGAAEQELQAVAQRASATKDELEAAKQEIARFKAMLGQ